MYIQEKFNVLMEVLAGLKKGVCRIKENIDSITVKSKFHCVLIN